MDASPRFVTTSHDVPNFQKDYLLEAMTQGVEEGYFTDNAGQYLLNGKQSPINADAAENVPDINFGACADDIFNVEDQQEVTPDMTQNTDNLVDIDSLLSNKSEWPETGATYSTRENNNPGDGKR